MIECFVNSITTAFKQSSEFKRPLRLMFDVNTGWTSILCMLNRFLQVDSVLNAAMHSIAKDDVKSVGEKPRTPLDPQSKTLFKNVCSILRKIDDTTMLLSRANEPAMHNLEPVTAGAIAKVDKMEVNNELKPI